GGGGVLRKGWRGVNGEGGQDHGPEAQATMLLRRHAGPDESLEAEPLALFSLQARLVLAIKRAEFLDGGAPSDGEPPGHAPPRPDRLRHPARPVLARRGSSV